MALAFLKLSRQELQDIVNECSNYVQLCHRLGWRKGVEGIRVRLKLENISISHFTRKKTRHPVTHYLKQNSPYIRSTELKRKLWKAKLLPQQCDICGLGNKWNGQPIVLQLDHINGHHTDNRLENLRIICPNCHVQTPTFCRSKPSTSYNTCKDCKTPIRTKNKRCYDCYRKTVPKRPAKTCEDCGTKVYNTSLRCYSCAAKARHKRPPKTCEDCDKHISHSLKLCRNCSPKRPPKTCEDCEKHISDSATRCRSCAGKARPKKAPKTCEDCGTKVYHTSLRCYSCAGKARRERPPKTCEDCDKHISDSATRCGSCAVKARPKKPLTRQRFKQCPLCGSGMRRRSKTCLSCYNESMNYVPLMQNQTRFRKVKRPAKEDLNMILSNQPFTKVGEMFGVSDNAVRKWCKAYGLPTKSSAYKKRKEVDPQESDSGKRHV